MAESIVALRKLIDAIDEKIVGLLNERAQIALKIKERKTLEGVSLHDGEREEEIIRHVKAVNRGPLSSRAIEHLFRVIIEHMHELSKERPKSG
jgi:chorismate mutase